MPTKLSIYKHRDHIFNDLGKMWVKGLITAKQLQDLRFELRIAQTHKEMKRVESKAKDFVAQDKAFNFCMKDFDEK